MGYHRHSFRFRFHIYSRVCADGVRCPADSLIHVSVCDEYCRRACFLVSHTFGPIRKCSDRRHTKFQHVIFTQKQAMITQVTKQTFFWFVVFEFCNVSKCFVMFRNFVQKVERVGATVSMVLAGLCNRHVLCRLFWYFFKQNLNKITIKSIRNRFLVNVVACTKGPTLLYIFNDRHYIPLFSPSSTTWLVNHDL